MKSIFAQQRIQDPTSIGVEGLKGIRNIFEVSEEPTIPSAMSTQNDIEALTIPRLEERNLRGDMEYVNTPGSFGKSMYDERVSTVAELEHLQDFRANEQSSIAKLGAGIGKGVSLAATTFVDGTLGLVYGLTQIPNQGLSALWNNDVSNALKEWNEKMEEYLPNYRTEEEENRPWYENLGTMNFWADSFIKNLGFTVGAYYSGAAWTKALKGIGLLKSALPAEIVGSTLSGINEGRIEANNNVGDWQKTQYLQLKDSYSKALNDLGFNGVDMLLDRNTPITDEIMQEINRREQTELSMLSTDNPMAQINAALVHNKYNQMRQSVIQNADYLNQLQEKYHIEQQEIQSRANSMGNGVLLANAVLLSYTNFMTYGKLYGGGFRTAKMSAEAGKKATLKEITQNAERLMGEEALKETSNRAIREGGRWFWNDITKKQALAKGLKTGAREGLEEMNQALISETAGYMQSPDSPDSYYEALLDADASVQVSKFLPALAKGFVNTYGNGERWEEGAIGALTGLLGMPTFGTQNMSNQTYLGKNKWIGLSGGLFGEFTDAKYQNERGKSAIDVMNRYEQKIQAQKDFFVQSQAFTNLMDGWAADGNTFEYKNAEDNDAFLAISAYARLGKLDYLKDLVNHDFENMSDEDLARIAAYTSRDTDTPTDTRYDGWRGVDGKLLSESEEGRKEMRDKLIEKRDNILKEIDSYENAIEVIRANFYNSPALTDDMTAELSWLYWKTKRFEDRFNQVKSEHSEHINRFVSGLQDWKNALIEEATEIENDESVKDILNENIEHQKQIDSMLEFLSAVQKAENPIGLSTFIEEHPDFIESIGKKEVYDIYADHTGFTYTDFKTMIEDIRDLGKLSISAKTFSERLKQYSENPQSILENRQKIEKKTQNTRNIAETANFISKMEEDSNGAIDELGIDAIKESIEKAEKTEGLSVEAQEKIKGIKDFVDSAEELSNIKQRILDKISSDSNLDPQTRKDVQKLLFKIKDKNGVFDLGNELYNDPTSLYEEGEYQGRSNDEIESLLQDRLEKAREALNAAKLQIDSEDRQLDDIAEGVSVLEDENDTVIPETGNDPTAKLDPVVTTGVTPVIPSVANSDLNFFVTFLEVDEKDVDTINALKFAIDILTQKGKQAFFTSNRYTPLLDKFGNNFNNAVNQFMADKQDIHTDSNPSNTSLNNPSEVEGAIAINNTIIDSLKDSKKYFAPIQSKLPIRLNPSNPNKLVPFYQLVGTSGYDRYTKEQVQYIKAVGKYLEDKGAWDRADNGLIKENEEIHFTTDPDLNKEAGAFVILMTDKEGNVLGNLPTEGLDNTFSTYVGLKEFSDFLKTAYETEGTIPQTIVSHLSRWMIGKVIFTDRNDVHSIREIFTKTAATGEETLGGIKFGVGAVNRSKQTRIVVDSSKRQDSAPDEGILPPKSIHNGQPYVIIPTGNQSWRRREIAIPVMMRVINTGDNSINNEIRKVLGQIFNVTYSTSATEIGKLKLQLEELVGAKFSISLPHKQVVTPETLDTEIEKFPIRLSIKTGNDWNTIISVNATTQEALDKAIESVMSYFANNNIRYQMSLKYVNKTYNGMDYNTMLADHVEVNMLPGITHTVSNWFTVNPMVKDGNIFKEVKAEVPRGTLAAAIVTQQPSTIEAQKPVQSLTPSPSLDNNGLSERSLEDRAQDAGILNDKVYQNIWKRLSSRLKEAVLGVEHKSPIEQMEVLKKHWDIRTKSLNLNEDLLEMELTGLFRKTDTNASEKWSKESEVKWLESVLPQFTVGERLQIVDSIIKVAGKADANYAWGQFKDGIMYIYKGAAKGTLYHEAFHAVSQTLLTSKELEALYKVAKLKYGDKSTIALEESLAEDFRKYIQFEQDPEISPLRLFFRKLKHLIQSLFGKDRYIDNIFYRISRGKFADRQIQNKLSENNREVNVDMEIADRQRDIDYARTEIKRIKEGKSNIKSKMWERWRFAINNSGFQHRHGDYDYQAQRFIDENGLNDVAVLLRKPFQDRYLEGYIKAITREELKNRIQIAEDKSVKELYGIIKGLQEEISYLKTNKSTIESQNALETQENGQIRDYYEENYSYDNLNGEDKAFLTENGISKDLYSSVPLEAQEHLFYCR